MTWYDALDRFGVATTILVMMLIAVWRILVFLAPRVDALFQRHIAFVDVVSVCQQKQAEAIDRLSSVTAVAAQEAAVAAKNAVIASSEAAEAVREAAVAAKLASNASMDAAVAAKGASTASSEAAIAARNAAVAAEQNRKDLATLQQSMVCRYTAPH